MSQTTTKEHNNKKEAAQKKLLQQVLMYVFGKAHFTFVACFFVLGFRHLKS